MNTYRKYMEKKEIIKSKEDGWDDLSDSSLEEVQLVSLYKYNKGRPLLQQQYSLEPDMVTGWMPKLPSCPIPLTYQNVLIHSVIQKVETDSRFQIIYRGPRHINSVQLHKSNSYRWKYRQKYEVKVNAISQAIEQIGKENISDGSHFNHCPLSSNQQQIKFNSNFESGNLDTVIRVKPLQYDCFIRSDTNTRGHTNWYYFKVNNGKSVGTVQFNICNIIKQKNLYNKGMTPYTLSKFLEDKYQIDYQWKQNQCYDVKFVQRLCRYGNNRVDNQLQFKYSFKQPNMEVSFAYSIPYTFSDLQDYLNIIKQKSYVKVTSLCQSFSGLELPLITIAKEERSYSKINTVIIARIHPGESNSSHMLQGFINSLLDQSKISQRLLASTNFYIIPMINPDGVVAGNYRTSFSGRDLNRSFNQIGHFLYPQINGLTDFIKKLKAQRKKVQFFFDFHSHSSKKDLFSYGPEHNIGTLHYFRSRILVKILEKQDSMFNYHNCIFHISEHKKSTVRSYMLKKQQIPMTYTFQISNGIYSATKQLESSYNKESLLIAGKIIFNGLSNYFLQFHKDINVQPKLKAIKFSKQQRFSATSLNNYHRLRKSLGCFRSQDLTARQNPDKTEQIKCLMNQIMEEKQIQEMKHQQGSDSELSENELTEDELQNLFSARKKYNLKTDQNKDQVTVLDKTIEKGSLRKIRTKKQIFKISSNSPDLSLKERTDQAASSPSIGLNKYKRNRIYYEQTHPRMTKKILQNPFENKKPIKQKKFPILF